MSLKAYMTVSTSNDESRSLVHDVAERIQSIIGPLQNAPDMEITFNVNNYPSVSVQIEKQTLAGGFTYWNDTTLEWAVFDMRVLGTVDSTAYFAEDFDEIMACFEKFLAFFVPHDA